MYTVQYGRTINGTTMVLQYTVYGRELVCRRCEGVPGMAIPGLNVYVPLVVRMYVPWYVYNRACSVQWLMVPANTPTATNTTNTSTNTNATTTTTAAAAAPTTPPPVQLDAPG